jgi:hypothetical protein
LQNGHYDLTSAVRRHEAAGTSYRQEVAVQPQQVDNQAALTATRRLDRLPPLERLAPRPEATAPAAGEQSAGDAGWFEVPVLDDGPSAVITVRYALDQVARTWVAHLFDAESGEMLREVPATDYHHQMAVLASLRRQRGVDTAA